LAPDILNDISQAVTPDGDGINDAWLISSIEKFQNNSVVIVDRWGNKVFHAVGYDNENIFWKGERENGALVPTGTYFYTIEVKIADTIIRKKGFLEVIQ
jgi:gliding motility-associated-like protein